MTWAITGLSLWRPGRAMWDLWWIKWQWERFFSVTIIPPMLHTHLPLHTGLMRRKS